MSLKDDGATAPLDSINESSEITEVSQSKPKNTKLVDIPIHNLQRLDVLKGKLHLYSADKSGMSGWSTAVGSSLLNDLDGKKHGVYLIVPKSAFPENGSPLEFIKKAGNLDKLFPQSYKVGSGDLISRCSTAFEATEPVGSWIADEDRNEEKLGKDAFYIIWFAGMELKDRKCYEALETSIQNYNEEQTGNIYVLADGGKTNGEGGTFIRKFNTYRKSCTNDELDNMLKEIHTEIIVRHTLALQSDLK